jgi:chromosome segregation ATPase
MEFIPPSTKLFMFTASSFALDSAIENFLKTEGAIISDFGHSAYIKSDIASVILSDLVKKSKASDISNANFSNATDTEKLKTENIKLLADNEKKSIELSQKTLQIESQDSQLAALKVEMSEKAQLIDILTAQNSQLNAKLKATLLSRSTTESQAGDDNKLRFEKLQNELQKLRIQNIEAITSLKVLEEENEQLQEELDQLKSRRTSNTITSNSG